MFFLPVLTVWSVGNSDTFRYPAIKPNGPHANGDEEPKVFSYFLSSIKIIRSNGFVWLQLLMLSPERVVFHQICINKWSTHYFQGPPRGCGRTRTSSTFVSEAWNMRFADRKKLPEAITPFIINQTGSGGLKKKLDIVEKRCFDIRDILPDRYGSKISRVPVWERNNERKYRDINHC